MSNKNSYLKFCASHKDLPVFYEPWYLNAVCNEDWEGITFEHNGELVAIANYQISKKGIWSLIKMPPLIKFMGLYFTRPVEAKVRKDIWKQYLSKLPKVDYFSQHLHYNINKEILPTQSSHNRMSYRLSGIQDLKSTWDKMRGDYRNNKIPKADDIVCLNSSGNIQDIIDVNIKTFSRQGLPLPVSEAKVHRLHEAFSKKRRCQVLLAQDKKSKEIHSGVYLIWDAQCCYLLMAGDDPKLRKSGSGIWLAWKAIEFASKELGLNQFDFLGSMIPSIARVRKQFGAVPTDYSSVEFYNSHSFKIFHSMYRRWKGH